MVNLCTERFSYLNSKLKAEGLLRYAGNPLALKIVSTTIQDVFDGSISTFLEQKYNSFGDISDLF